MNKTIQIGMNTCEPCQPKNANFQEVDYGNLKWLSCKEAAIYLRKSVGQIRNMVYRGQIRARKYNSRLYFNRRELDNLIEASNTFRRLR